MGYVVVSVALGALLSLPSLLALGLVLQSPRATICAALILAALAATLPLSWGIGLGLAAFGLLVRGIEARSADTAAKASRAASVDVARPLNGHDNVAFLDQEQETIEEQWLREAARSFKD